MLKEKTIVIGVTGGIAAYKVCDLIRRLRERGADIHVMMTKSAREFITPLTFQALSQNPVHTDLFDLTQEQKISHIELADRANLVLIAPATADILAKVAHGLCDDLVTTVLCATQAPILFAPSMNVHMWENRITRENVSKLRGAGYSLLEPAEGSLACGYEGAGRLPETDILLRAIEKIFEGDGKKAVFSV